MHTDHLRAFDAEIERLLDEHPDAPIFLSFPGIGPVVAAALIAEMGDDRDPVPDGQHAAGRDRAGAGDQGLRPDPAGPVPLRREPADAARHRLVDLHRRSRRPVVEERSTRTRRARGQGKYRALRGIGARWMRILWRCWINHTRRAWP